MNTTLELNRKVPSSCLLPPNAADSDSEIDLNIPEDENTGLSKLAMHHLAALPCKSSPAKEPLIHSDINNRKTHSRTQKSSLYDRSQFVQMSFDQRQKHWEAKKKANEEATALVMFTEEQAKCTFVPCTGRTDSSSTKRDLKKFLEDQDKFAMQKSQRLENALKDQRKKEQEKMRNAPAINPASSMLSSKLGPTHERLYSFDKENKGGLRITKEESYIYRKMSRSRQQQAKAEECVRNKISRDLTKAVMECNGNTVDRITYVTLEKILKKFGMLKERDDKANTQRKLLVKLWEIFEGNTRDGVAFDALKIVIYSIMKVPGGQPGLERRLTNNSDRLFGNIKTTYGNFNEDGEFSVTETEAQNLHKLFSTFYLNKIAQDKDKAKVQKFSHTPKLGASTLRLARGLKEKRRELLIRKIQETSFYKAENPTIADLLAADKQDQEKLFMSYKKKVEAERLKECTFRPSLGAKPSGNAEKRCQSLYKLSRTQKKKMDKTTEEIEFEKQKEELTFTPNKDKHHKRLRSADLSNMRKSVPNIRAYQDSVQRLSKARYDKECVEMAKTLGMTLAQIQNKGIVKRNHNKASKSMCNVTAWLEIRVDGKKEEEKVVKKGESVEKVAKRVATKHDLSMRDSEKILEEIQRQLNSVKLY